MGHTLVHLPIRTQSWENLRDIGSSKKSCSIKVKKKMQEKMKMISQKNENLVYVQQQYGVSFCEKNDSKSGFF